MCKCGEKEIGSSPHPCPLAPSLASFSAVSNETTLASLCVCGQANSYPFASASTAVQHLHDLASTRLFYPFVLSNGHSGIANPSEPHNCFLKTRSRAVARRNAVDSVRQLSRTNIPSPARIGPEADCGLYRTFVETPGMPIPPFLFAMYAPLRSFAPKKKTLRPCSPWFQANIRPRSSSSSPLQETTLDSAVAT